MGLFDKLLRSGEGRKLRTLEAVASDVADAGESVGGLTDTQLAARTEEFRDRLASGEDLDDILVEAFATIREASGRVLGMRHFDVQVMGGAAMHLGWIAEMGTGEGKTLAATLPVYLNALAGNGVHVATANDYLAARDAEQMGELYRFMGLTVGLVVDGIPHAERAPQYAADITYGTATQFGFDFLRDNMVLSVDARAQRGHSYAVVDEIDSILIDEARTPLILSVLDDSASRRYEQFAEIVGAFTEGVHYERDLESRSVWPLPEGISVVEKALGVSNIYDLDTAEHVAGEDPSDGGGETHPSGSAAYHLAAALQAKAMRERDVDYIVDGGEVKIVDEMTGRVMDGRRWSDGIHEAVEAAEGVQIAPETRTLATVTLQNYFGRYDKLAGMTGTAMSEAAEFGATYGLPVVQIPPNRPSRRVDEFDLVYRTRSAKHSAIVDDVAERHRRGQPVLIGTVSVESSELLSEALREAGIDHEVLNAKNAAREAQIIAQAGTPGAVTVATNMAGRGVDILLGGNPEMAAAAELVAGGDDPDSEGFDERVSKRSWELAAEMSADAQRVRDAGGLAVIGTERHESRRIDNQLRGRAGRQGDPGSSRFYLALDDELLSIFATDLAEKIMGQNWPADQPIESKLVSRAVEKAQGAVERRNAEQRKRTLDYDEVLEAQRNAFFSRRDEVLDGTLDPFEVLAQGWEEAARRVCDPNVTSDPFSIDAEAVVSAAAANWATTNLTVSAFADVASVEDAYELVIADLEALTDALIEAGDAEVFTRFCSHQLLLVMDELWTAHLTEMDVLRDGIGLRGLASKDPLVEWKREATDRFAELSPIVAVSFAKLIANTKITPVSQAV